MDAQDGRDEVESEQSSRCALSSSFFTVFRCHLQRLLPFTGLPLLPPKRNGRRRGGGPPPDALGAHRQVRVIFFLHSVLGGSPMHICTPPPLPLPIPSLPPSPFALDLHLLSASTTTLHSSLSIVSPSHHSYQSLPSARSPHSHRRRPSDLGTTCAHALILHRVLVPPRCR